MYFYTERLNCIASSLCPHFVVNSVNRRRSHGPAMGHQNLYFKRVQKNTQFVPLLQTQLVMKLECSITNRVMRRHDLPNQKTLTKTKKNTKTIYKYPQRRTLETCDLWELWSWWRGNKNSQKIMINAKPFGKIAPSQTENVVEFGVEFHFSEHFNFSHWDSVFVACQKKQHCCNNSIF